MKRPLRLLFVAGLVSVSSVILPSAPAGAPVASAAGCTLCAGGEYHPIAPVRIFDSRTLEAVPELPINDVAPLGSKPLGASNPSFDLQLLGIDDPEFENPWVPTDEGIQADDILAVAVSVTVISPTVRGYMGAHPTGSPSDTSVLNFGAGQTVANLTIVRPGTGGELTLWMHGDAAGSADVAIDVYGWISTSGYLGFDGVESADERGGRIIPVGPGRVFDNRPGTLGPQGVQEIAIRGADTVVAPIITDIVPDSADVEGVVVNITAVQPTATTFISALPENPVGMPTTSNVNVPAGAIKANMAMVPVGADGKIRLYNHSGNVKLIVDVVAYILKGADETRAGRVIPLTAPFRALDTRQPEFGGVPLGPGAAEDWDFAPFADSVSIGGVPVGHQAGLIGNLTNAKLTRQYPTVGVTSYLTVYPTPAVNGQPPTVSNVNTVESVASDPKAVPNMALIRYSDDLKVRVFNYQGYAHYILDVSAVILAD